MKKSLLTLAFITTSLNLFAFRVPEVPLKVLIDSSEYIIYGTVISVLASDTVKEKELAKKYDFWIYCQDLEYIAKVKIMKQLKVKNQLDTVFIKFNYGQNGYCGGYIKNDTMITFLNKNEDETFCRTSCYFGIKSHGPEEYADRIVEYLSLKNRDTLSHGDALVEWHLKCAEGYFTCQEGLYFFKDHNLKYFDSSSPIHFTDSRKHRLSTALLSFSPFQIGHTDLLSVVCDFDNSLQLKNYILKNLKELKINTAYLTAYDLMKAYLKFDNSKKLEKIYERLFLYDHGEVEYPFKIAQEFIYEIERK